MTHIKKLTNLLLVTLILFGHNVGTPAIPRECVLNPDTLTQALPQDTLPELTVEKSVVEHKGKTDTYLITKEMRGDAAKPGISLGKYQACTIIRSPRLSPISDQGMSRFLLTVLREMMII